MTYRTPKTFGINLKLLREAMNITQAKLSEEIDIPLYRIKKYETHSYTHIIEDDKKKIANFFQYSIEAMQEDILTTKTAA